MARTGVRGYEVARLPTRPRWKENVRAPFAFLHVLGNWELRPGNAELGMTDIVRFPSAVNPPGSLSGVLRKRAGGSSSQECNKSPQCPIGAVCNIPGLRAQRDDVTSGPKARPGGPGAVPPRRS